jgi:hypothetical protein
MVPTRSPAGSSTSAMGFDERFVYVHDPFIDVEENKSPTDCVNMPILKQEFSGMARYGRAAQRAVVILRARKD